MLLFLRLEIFRGRCSSCRSRGHGSGSRRLFRGLSSPPLPRRSVGCDNVLALRMSWLSMAVIITASSCRVASRVRDKFFLLDHSELGTHGLPVGVIVLEEWMGLFFFIFLVVTAFPRCIVSVGVFVFFPREQLGPHGWLPTAAAASVVSIVVIVAVVVPPLLLLVGGSRRRNGMVLVVVAFVARTSGIVQRRRRPLLRMWRQCSMR